MNFLHLPKVILVFYHPLEKREREQLVSWMESLCRDKVFRTALCLEWEDNGPVCQEQDVRKNNVAVHYALGLRETCAPKANWAF